MSEHDPQAAIDRWLSGPIDQESKAEILELQRQSPEDLNNAFYTTLAFGTGGMRGLMGVGTNRINKYTVQMATQGLANYLRKEAEKPSVFIGYDNRNHSKELAMEAARVLAGNQIEAYICTDLRPTPFVSYGLRQKRCAAGIMITASHNPKEYNGYKVFWNDGAQVVAPHDKEIVDEVARVTDFSQIHLSPEHSPLINLVGPGLDLEYIDTIKKLQPDPKEDKELGDRLSITYTPLHGTGATLIPKALKAWGFSNMNVVDAQLIPDGNFPTVKSPNPESLTALELGLKQMEATGSDLLIATDPDADRMGTAALYKGKPFVFTGNQIAAICLEFLCDGRTLPEKSAAVSTIVSTELLQEIAEKHGVAYFDVLTGFKYIGEKIHLWETGHDPHNFLFGAEESYGYLIGTHARDKDAIVASCLIADIALMMKQGGKTLVDYLCGIYKRYGFFSEGQRTIDFPPGKAGMEEMTEMMETLRKRPPQEIAGRRVHAFEDYACSLRQDYDTGRTEPLTLPPSNVLLFRLEGKGKVVVRPSGTEPKLKIYGGVYAPEFTEIYPMMEWGKEQLDGLFDATQALLH